MMLQRGYADIEERTFAPGQDPPQVPGQEVVRNEDREPVAWMGRAEGTDAFNQFLLEEGLKRASI